MSLGLIRCLAMIRTMDVGPSLPLASPPKTATKARGSAAPMLVLIVSLAAAMFCASVLAGHF
jgi:hypothetical protein